MSSKPKAKVLNVWGCSSHAGKTTVTAGLCRLFYRLGLRVAPFKAQNMALNAMVSKEGKEMAAAQAYQALACGLEPSVDMNPVLLKPEGDRKSELIVQGKSWGSFDVMGYYAIKRKLLKPIAESFFRLSEMMDVIVVEGAGSCAEVNLRRFDLANRFLYYLKGEPDMTLLVADIERGGVFAQIVGTHRLLTPKERAKVQGVIINKFRGDPRLLDGGLRRIERACRWGVLAVLPYIEGFRAIDEDALSLEDGFKAKAFMGFGGQPLRVGVVKFRRVSNVTDFAPLKEDGRFDVRLIEDPKDLKGLDLLILPGTKRVGTELRFLEQSGLKEAILKFQEDGGWVLGLCGGFEILCEEIEDPSSLELEIPLEKGLGLVPSRVRFEKARLKVVKSVRVLKAAPGFKPFPPLLGYEIHKGRIEGILKENAWFKLDCGDGALRNEGFLDPKAKVMGTFLHGLFDRPGFRDYLLFLIKGDAAPLENGRGLFGGVDFQTKLMSDLESFLGVLSSRLKIEALLSALL